jgi:hypothetical protein
MHGYRFRDGSRLARLPPDSTPAFPPYSVGGGLGARTLYMYSNGWVLAPGVPLNGRPGPFHEPDVISYGMISMSLKK